MVLVVIDALDELAQGTQRRDVFTHIEIEHVTVHVDLFYVFISKHNNI